MKMQDAMVWWNDREEHKDHPGQPMLLVLSNEEDGNERFAYLSNSTGACCGGWESTDPERLAVHLLAIYAWATGRNGVPADVAHREFLKIDEYREWIEYETGPFAAAYPL
jgi:hypothetical protein